MPLKRARDVLDIVNVVCATNSWVLGSRTLRRLAERREQDHADRQQEEDEHVDEERQQPGPARSRAGGTGVVPAPPASGSTAACARQASVQRSQMSPLLDRVRPVLGHHVLGLRDLVRSSGTNGLESSTFGSCGRRGRVSLAVGLHRRQLDRPGEALQPAVLAAVGLLAVEVLLPQPGRGRVRRVGADRLGVEAGDQAVGRVADLPVDALLLQRRRPGRRSGSPSRGRSASHPRRPWPA